VASKRPGALADKLNARYVEGMMKGMYINVLNRFRQVPMFGRFTIHHFHNNISEMKKLAARDFEDILQVHTYTPVRT